MTLGWGPFGITANYIQPGAIIIEITRGLFEEDQEFRNKWTKKASVGRLGETEDIDHAAEFLCSEKSSFLTGHGLVVDGGALLT